MLFRKRALEVGGTGCGALDHVAADDDDVRRRNRGLRLHGVAVAVILQRR